MEKRIEIKEKVGYMFGDMAIDSSFMMAVTYLMVFYTDVLGIQAAYVGTLFFFARIWDAFMDVLWGRFIDLRAPGKNGKFKPWFIRFSVPFVISSILLFTKIPGMSENFYLFYAIAIYIIWGSLFSTVSIPFGSLASVMTSDPVERSVLSSFRNSGSTIATLCIGFFGPLVLFVGNKANADRFFIAVLVVAVISIIFYILCYKMITERIVATGKAVNSTERSLKDSLKSLIKNRAFITLIASSLLLMFALMSALNAYLYKDYFHDIKAMSVLNVLAILNLFIIPPLVPLITKKFGKKESVSAALLGASIIYFILFLLPITNPYVFIAISFVGNLLAALFTFTIWAFVAEVVDYHEILTGKREDGTVYSIYTFSRKIGQAISGGAIGFMLAAIGYVQKAPQQSAEVGLNIKRVATLVPSIVYFLIFLILVFAYPLTKEKIEQITKTLAEKRG